MKLFTCLIVMLLTSHLYSQQMTVMTYNIRYDAPDDGTNNWAHRKHDVADLIKSWHPMLVGTQEGLKHQLTYLDSALTDYAYIGVGRDDGQVQGEYCAVFYDTTFIRLIMDGTFWLSETPDTPSLGWDAGLPRICTYGLFEMKETSADLWIFNTHFDHIAVEARRRSSELILERIGQTISRHPAPVILMGDFNATPDQEPVQIIQREMTDAASVAGRTHMVPYGTYSGFNPDVTPDKRIDYIFTRGTGLISEYIHVADMRQDGGFVSDHLPVMVKLSLQ